MGNARDAVTGANGRLGGAEGGYYSTLDADSENEEGKFYVWDTSQIANILPPEEYVVVAPYYGLERGPNFEGKSWHLEIARPLAEVAEAIGISLEEAEKRLGSARRKLFLNVSYVYTRSRRKDPDQLERAHD